MNNVQCLICGKDAKYDFSGRDMMFKLYEKYDYFSCEYCKTVFQYPQPSLDKIASFYPAEYDIYVPSSQQRKLSAWKRAELSALAGYQHLQVNKTLCFGAKLLSRFIHIDKPKFVRDGALLDVGCGNGKYLKSMQNLGWNVFGVELSQHGVDACESAGLNVHKGDLFSAELLSESFDVITARHVIEHVPDVDAFVRELARLLKKGGQLIIETPNSNALGRSIFGSKWFANEVPRHLALLSEQAITLLAEKYNLRVQKSVQHTTPKIFLNSVDYVIENNGKPSNKRKWRRLLAKPYVWYARKIKRGDVLYMVLSK